MNRLVRLSLLALPFYPFQVEPSSEPPPVIHHITIQGNTRTHTEVIRRELLFSPGEKLDSSLVAETARNLRRLLYLGKADIQIQEEEGEAAILVEVQDLYSRALSPLLSGEIDELSYGLVALDYNFLGRGQITQLSLYHQAISGNSATAYYRIPRLLGSRHALTTRVGAGEEGHEAQLALSRPLYALSARWAYGVTLFTQEHIQRLYNQQNLAARYTDRLNGTSLWLVRSSGNQFKFRPSLRLRLSDHRFEPSQPFTYAPRDRRRLLPSVGLTIWRPRYEQTRFIHALGRTEDLQIGNWLSLGLGLSHQALGSDQSFGFYQVQLSPRFKPYANGYTLISLFLSTRQQRSGYRNLFALAELRTYARIRQIHSLALRLRWDALSRSEDNTQLLLGVAQGLRGYPPRRFNGTRRFLFNLEARPTLYRHSLYVLAGAVFLDGGTAWIPNHSSPDLSLALGAGARLGLPQVYNTPVLRLDLAYGLDDRVWQVFFGIGQYF